MALTLNMVIPAVIIAYVLYLTMRAAYHLIRGTHHTCGGHTCGGHTCGKCPLETPAISNRPAVETYHFSRDSQNSQQMEGNDLMSEATPKTMRLFGVVTDSIVDGPGFRTAVFTQGCPHHCEGCHNPESHDFQGGKVWTLDNIEQKFSGNPLLSGLTLTGGEPFAQAAACAELARRAKAKNLNVWVYSGYTYEQLRAMNDADVDRLLESCDVLVDGPFILAKRSLELLFCGSVNQRLIDLAKTRETGKIVLYQPPEW